jgi:hypothetical protein
MFRPTALRTEEYLKNGLLMFDIISILLIFDFYL